MQAARAFSVVDSHTAGHPTRTITAGLPPLGGGSVLNQRNRFREKYDALRAVILHEPRGHAAMVAAVPVPSTVADQGLFFISSYIYLDMCGHATIGYIATLAAMGALPADMATRGMSIETPAGIIHVNGTFQDDRLTGVILRNVPSYVGVLDGTCDAGDFGTINFDLVYGGIWYAIVDATKIALPFTIDSAAAWCRLGMTIKGAINAGRAGRAGGEAQASSVLFYEAVPGGAKHLVVLARNKFDRSPCGTGTSARLAQLAARGELRASEHYRAENLMGVSFDACFAPHEAVDGVAAILPEVRGMAHITAFSTLVVEADDPLAAGFLPG